MKEFNLLFAQDECHLRKNIQLHHTKAIGIQTESVESDLATDELRQSRNFSNKMLSIWGSTTERKSGRYFISRLLGCCSEDLCVLFGFIGVPSCEYVLDDLKCASQSVEAQKVSQLYSIMMKVVNNRVLIMEAIFSCIFSLFIGLCILCVIEQFFSVLQSEIFMRF